MVTPEQPGASGSVTLLQHFRGASGPDRRRAIGFHLSHGYDGPTDPYTRPNRGRDRPSDGYEPTKKYDGPSQGYDGPTAPPPFSKDRRNEAEGKARRPASAH